MTSNLMISLQMTIKMDLQIKFRIIKITKIIKTIEKYLLQMSIQQKMMKILRTIIIILIKNYRTISLILTRFYLSTVNQELPVDL